MELVGSCECVCVRTGVLGVGEGGLYGRYHYEADPLINNPRNQSFQPLSVSQAAILLSICQLFMRVTMPAGYQGSHPFPINISRKLRSLGAFRAPL